VKQKQLAGIESMADAYQKQCRHDKHRKQLLYAAILELEYNPHPDDNERERIEKLVKKLRRGL